MRVLVIIGPSGAGKSTVIRELQRRRVIDVTRSWTTRPRRHDEVGDDSTHQFVTDGEFDSLDESGYFIDTVTMFGFRYGLPGVYGRAAMVPAIVVRASLLDIIDRHFPDRVVYQIECDRETAYRRLQGRGVPAAEVDERMAEFDEEVNLGRGSCDRDFDTSGGSLEIVDAIEEAIRNDFSVRTPAPRLSAARPNIRPSSLATSITTTVVVILLTIGLGTVAYAVLVAVALASWGSSK